MAGLFISHRREDASGDAGRLFDTFKACCRTAVYLDVDIPAGVDFRASLRNALDACDAVLVLIGPRWATINKDTGFSRLADPDDFVRFEIATALAARKTVIPVLLPGGTLPRPTELPDDIKELVWREAVDIRYDRWAADVDALIAQLPAAVRCAPRNSDVPLTRSVTSALVAIVLISAVHIFAVLKVESVAPEVLDIGLSLGIGALLPLRFTSSFALRGALAAGIGIGVGLLTSLVIPLMLNQDIIPHSIVPVRDFVLLVAEVFGGFVVGAVVVDALRHRTRPRKP